MRKFYKSMDPHQKNIKILIILFAKIRAAIFVTKIRFCADINRDSCLPARFLTIRDQLRDPFVPQTKCELFKAMVCYRDFL